MVFIPPNTFRMGSPTNEFNRSVEDGPLTTVILTRGFWVGKYEVTQREYLAIMNNNPSFFPTNLDAPVSSVSWVDATNYCAKLTQLYRTYVNNPNDPRPVQPSPTAEYEQAINECAKGNTAAGIPPLEQVLRNNKFTLPSREG